MSAESRAATKPKGVRVFESIVVTVPARHFAGPRKYYISGSHGGEC
jgi:hypothetical protein